MATAPAPAFRKAERHAVKARIALAGPSGSGKTYTGLVLGSALVNGGRLAVLDTEKGSSELYADEFDFDVLHLDPPFSPERYVAGITAAVEGGYAVVLIDSLSHAWSDEGGVLDIVDQEAARTQGNKFAAWRKGTPEQQKLINGLIRSPIHMIVTMRSKQDYALDHDDKGRTRVRKLGLAPIQREGVEYEFSVFGELDLDHTLSISKSRYKTLQDLVVKKPGPDFARQVLREVEVGEPSGAAETEAAGEAQESVPDDPGTASSDHPAKQDSPTAPAPAAAPDQTKEPEASIGEGTASGSEDPPMEGPATADQLERVKFLFHSEGKVVLAARQQFGDSVTKIADLTAEQVRQLILEKTGS
jgi:hypothetical protein